MLDFLARRATARADDQVSLYIPIHECQYNLANGIQAWLSANKSILLEGQEPEHTIRFDRVAPTLGDLRWVFWAIVQVLDRYELFRVRRVQDFRPSD